MIFLTELILFITTQAITGHKNDSSYSVIMNLKILPLVIRLTTKTTFRYFDFRHDCQYGSFHCLKNAGLFVIFVFLSLKDTEDYRGVSLKTSINKINHSLFG